MNVRKIVNHSSRAHRTYVVHTNKVLASTCSGSLATTFLYSNYVVFFILSDVSMLVDKHKIIMSRKEKRTFRICVCVCFYCWLLNADVQCRLGWKRVHTMAPKVRKPEYVKMKKKRKEKNEKKKKVI